jgi:hypothetical protein
MRSRDHDEVAMPLMVGGEDVVWMHGEHDTHDRLRALPPHRPSVDFTNDHRRTTRRGASSSRPIRRAAASPGTTHRIDPPTTSRPRHHLLIPHPITTMTVHHHARPVPPVREHAYAPFGAHQPAIRDRDSALVLWADSGGDRPARQFAGSVRRCRWWRGVRRAGPGRLCVGRPLWDVGLWRRAVS